MSTFPGQDHYACCQPFNRFEPGDRPTPNDLCSAPVLIQGMHDLLFEVVEVAGSHWLLQGPVVVLRPTPEYCRVTQVGVEEPRLWHFKQDDLLDQLDDICTGYVLPLVAAQGPSGSWRAGFGGGRWFEGETLEEALWAAV